MIRALFPEKEDGLNNLYVTMSFLKKQISDLNLKKSDIVIKNNYFLEVADGICDFIDAERYINKHIVIDDQNISQFLLILDSFRGTFLEEEDYLWAYDTREYLEKKYEEVLLKIGKYYGRKKNFEEARNAIERIIHRNPLSCEAHAEFLNLYLYFKRYDLFLTQYRRYARLLKEEYGEVPEIEYAEAYQKLWSNWNKD